MKLCVGTAKELGHPKPSMFLSDLVSRHRPPLVCLLETKAKAQRSCYLRCKYRFLPTLFSFFHVMLISGGLALFWNNSGHLRRVKHLSMVQEMLRTYLCYGIISFYLDNIVTFHGLISVIFIMYYLIMRKMVFVLQFLKELMLFIILKIRATLSISLPWGIFNSITLSCLLRSFFEIIGVVTCLLSCKLHLEITSVTCFFWCILVDEYETSMSRKKLDRSSIVMTYNIK